MNLTRSQRLAAGGSSKTLLLTIVMVAFLVVGVALWFWLGRYGRSTQPGPGNLPVSVLEAGPKELAVAVTKEFQYAPKGFPLGLAAGQTRLRPFSSTPPPNLKKAPSADGEIAYVTLPLGNVEEERISVAMVGRQRLYFDDNGNGDFSDDADPCPKLSCTRNLTVAVRAEDGSIERRPYTIWFWFIESQGAPRFYSRCHYVQDIRIGSETYRAVAFEKERHNGLLHDDGLWIDLDKDGKLSKEEHFMDGQRFPVAGQEYWLALKSL